MLVLGAHDVVPAASLAKAEVAGGQGHALARRLRRLGSQTREKLASVELCLEGEQWCLAHVLPSPLVSCIARVLGSSC